MVYLTISTGAGFLPSPLSYSYFTSYFHLCKIHWKFPRAQFPRGGPPASKTVETRRCRSCHNVRAALNRMTKNHGNLVSDFTHISGDKLQSFYEAHSDLRGDDLKVKIADVVSDWKESNIPGFEFNEDGWFHEWTRLAREVQEQTINSWRPSGLFNDRYK